MNGKSSTEFAVYLVKFYEVHRQHFHELIINGAGENKSDKKFVFISVSEANWN